MPQQGLRRLSVGFTPNPRLRPLLDGTVRFDTFEPQWDLMPHNELFLRLLTSDDLDVFELSIDRLLTTRGPNDEPFRWAAIPVFLTQTSNQFRCFVTDGSRMSSVADLRGRRVLVPIYQMSGLVWMRAVLRLYYGIAHDDIAWIVAPPAPPGERPKWIVEDPPQGANVVSRAAGNWTQMLLSGEVDAVYYPWLSPEKDRPDGIRPLLSTAEAREIWVTLRRDTGAVPINHLVGFQHGLSMDAHGLAGDLYKTFEEAKTAAMQIARAGAGGYFLFPDEDADRQASQFGEDPFPFGLEPNRASLNLYADQMVLEGFIDRRPDPEEYLSAFE